MNKGGHPPLVPGQHRKVTSVSLTASQQTDFRKLGGSKWLREQIDKATKERQSESVRV